MRLSLRFALPLLIVLAAFAYGMVPFVDQLMLQWSVRDLDIRASLIANTIQEPIQDQLATGSTRKLANFFAHITQDERLFALGYCPSTAGPFIATKTMPAEIRCNDLADYATATGGRIIPSQRGSYHVAVKALPSDTSPDGKLVLVHDMSFIERRSEETKRYIFWFFVGLTLTVSLLTVIIAQLSWRGWMQGMRALMRGEGLLRQPGAPIQVPELRPIARDLQRLIRDLESEHRARDEAQLAWTAETLRGVLHGELRGDDVIVVSNREPYIHVKRGDRVEVQQPASGLVTALEPIMRACSGVWIAHGSGSADREVVDRDDCVEVPPGNPAYRIHRVWLSPEEEAGYYYGFANEGLWPLCHIAHVRPVFRSSDWAHYVAVNRRFAEAVVNQSKKSNPIVLVQDYHLALVPRMIRERLPQATIITFWHIPWPNPESFAICPWREELISGLLGSSILGFHTQFHCNNFVDTVDAFIEARVDRESFTVTLGGKPTAVRRYPISIDWPPAADVMEKPAADCRADIRRENGLKADQFVGIGVDRLDYTKGIIERFMAVERLFELKPEWIGRFTFLQIAAPTRSSIDEYHAHEELVRTTAQRINDRFGREGAPAIVLKVQHHGARQVYEHYRAADLCFVSSLHDGMNLVAKEFVAARNDDRGVLILSQFTGAARELPEALIVNPYDADQCAAALHIALVMPQAEQRDRMRLMRGLVSEFNVYRWAGRMLLDAASMRRRAHLQAGPGSTASSGGT
jgi:trehalose 6-phosphate synthase